MGERRDVVIVGGGIIGASIGYQLARRWSGSVLILDKGAGPGEGSTGASSAICRLRYSHADVIRLARDGQETYARWDEFTGLAAPRSGLRRVGVAWLMDWSAEFVAGEVARLQAAGAQAEALSPSDLVDRFPALSPCTAPLDPQHPEQHECRPPEAILFEPTSGYADPTGALQDLLEAFRREGGEVRFSAPVTGLATSRDRVTGVELEGGGRISAGVVLNAAGPWCHTLNSSIGLELPWTLVPTRIQTLSRAWPAELGPLPVAAEASTGIYLRPDGADRVLVGSVLPEDEEEAVDDPDRFRRQPDPDFQELKLAAFHHRVPRLPPRGQVSGICGLYTMNREDVHPLVGPSGIEGLWLAIGMSGHGFKLAPMIGSMVARELTGEAASFDTDVPLSLFAVDRQPITVETKNVLA